MKLHVLVGLQAQAVGFCEQAASRVQASEEILEQIAQEIAAAFPQHFSQYICGMGVQAFYWTPEVKAKMAGNDPCFDPTACDESEWGYNEFLPNGNDTVFVPFPAELFEALRIYNRVSAALSEFHPNTYARPIKGFRS